MFRRLVLLSVAPLQCSSSLPIIISRAARPQDLAEMANGDDNRSFVCGQSKP